MNSFLGFMQKKEEDCSADFDLMLRLQSFGFIVTIWEFYFSIVDHRQMSKHPASNAGQSF